MRNEEQNSLPKIDANKIDPEGALRLAETLFKSIADDYKRVYREYLQAKERVEAEERAIRRSPLVKIIAENMDDVIASLQENTRKEYRNRGFIYDDKRISKSGSPHGRNK